MDRIKATLNLSFDFPADWGDDQIIDHIKDEVLGFGRRHELEQYIEILNPQRNPADFLYAVRHESAFGPVPGAYMGKFHKQGAYDGVDILCSCKDCRAAHALANLTPDSPLNQADIVETPDGEIGNVYQTNPEDTRVQVIRPLQTLVLKYPTSKIFLMGIDPNMACPNCKQEHQACPCGNPTYCPPDEPGEPFTRCNECDEAIKAAEVLGIARPELIILTKDVTHVGRDASLIDVPSGTRCAVRTHLTNGPAVSPLNVPVQVRQLVKGESYRTKGDHGEVYIYQGFNIKTNRHEFMPEKPSRFDGGVGVHETKIPTTLQHHFKIQLDHSQYRPAI